MTGRAAIDARSRMLVNERPILVRMTLGACQLFETAEQHARSRCMGIVARRAFHRTLEQTMTLVELEGSELIVVTVDAELARRAHPPEQPGQLDKLRPQAQQGLR